QPEEGVCLLWLDRQIAKLINQQGLHAAQLAQQPGGRAIGQRGVKFVEQDLRIVEAAAVAVEAGFTQQPDPQSSFTSTGSADQQDIVGTAQEVQPGQGLDLCLADPRLA